MADYLTGRTLGTYSTLSGVERKRPEAYKSRHQGTIENLLNNIVNRESFNYDIANDQLYNQYKEAYTQLGQQAMNDTVSAMEGLSGGYGNTYAAPAASEGYQDYMRQVNDIIPELYQIAMNKHAMETDDLLNRFKAVGTAEDREYGQYRDTVNDWKIDRDYYFDKYKIEDSDDRAMAELAQDDRMFNSKMQYQYDRDAWEERKKAEAEAEAAAAKALKESQKKSGKGRKGRKKGSSEEAVDFADLPTTGTAATPTGYLRSGRESLINFKNSDSVANFYAGQIKQGNLTTDQALKLMNIGNEEDEEESILEQLRKKKR